MTQEHSKQVSPASLIVLSCYSVFISCSSTEGRNLIIIFLELSVLKTKLNWAYELVIYSLGFCQKDIKAISLVMKSYTPSNKFIKLRNILNNLSSIIFMNSSSKDCPLTPILKAFVKGVFNSSIITLLTVWFVEEEAGTGKLKLYAYSNIGFSPGIEYPFLKTERKMKYIDIILNTVCSLVCW